MRTATHRFDTFYHHVPIKKKENSSRESVAFDGCKYVSTSVECVSHPLPSSIPLYGIYKQIIVNDRIYIYKWHKKRKWKSGNLLVIQFYFFGGRPHCITTSTTTQNSPQDSTRQYFDDDKRRHPVVVGVCFDDARWINISRWGHNTLPSLRIKIWSAKKTMIN